MTETAAKAHVEAVRLRYATPIRNVMIGYGVVVGLVLATIIGLGLIASKYHWPWHVTMLAYGAIAVVVVPNRTLLAKLVEQAFKRHDDGAHDGGGE